MLLQKGKRKGKGEGGRGKEKEEKMWSPPLRGANPRRGQEKIKEKGGEEDGGICKA